MTEREAVEKLHDLVGVPDEMIIKYNGIIKDEQIVKLKELKEVQYMAISALEKQIPKKPIILKKYPNSVKAKCTECNGMLIGIHYCPNCGQKLLWESDTE